MKRKMRFFLAESLELSLLADYIQITMYMANKKLPKNANLKIISTLNETLHHVDDTDYYLCDSQPIFA